MLVSDLVISAAPLCPTLLCKSFCKCSWGTQEEREGCFVCLSVGLSENPRFHLKELGFHARQCLPYRGKGAL